MKRLWWLLRVAFHDWMWEGGDKASLGQRLARRLPWYFSDPYAIDFRAHADEALEWAATTSRAFVPPIYINDAWSEVPNTTATLGTSATVTYRWNGR